MAARKAPKPAAPETEDDTPARTYLDKMSAYLTTTPIRTRDDQVVKDEIRRSLAERDQTIGDFVEEKKAEGLSVDDINELYALQSQLVPVAEVADGRTRLRWGYQIVERAN